MAISEPMLGCNSLVLSTAESVVTVPLHRWCAKHPRYRVRAPRHGPSESARLPKSPSPGVHAPLARTRTGDPRGSAGGGRRPRARRLPRVARHAGGARVGGHPVARPGPDVRPCPDDRRRLAPGLCPSRGYRRPGARADVPVGGPRTRRLAPVRSALLPYAVATRRGRRSTSPPTATGPRSPSSSPTATGSRLPSDWPLGSTGRASGAPAGVLRRGTDNLTPDANHRTPAERSGEPMSRVSIVSTDGHAVMPLDAWPEYLEPEFHDHLARVPARGRGERAGHVPDERHAAPARARRLRHRGCVPRRGLDRRVGLRRPHRADGS